MTALNEGRPLILVAVDGSPSSLRAGAYAAGLARGRNARVVCLYVRTPLTLLSSEVPSVDLADRECKDLLASEIRELCLSGAGAVGLSAEFVERSGAPYVEIVRLANEVRADLVIVGGSSKVGHRVVGAIGARLVRCGRWPVTVVP